MLSKRKSDYGNEIALRNNQSLNKLDQIIFRRMDAERSQPV